MSVMRISLFAERKNLVASCHPAGPAPVITVGGNKVTRSVFCLPRLDRASKVIGWYPFKCRHVSPDVVRCLSSVTNRPHNFVFINPL